MKSAQTLGYTPVLPAPGEHTAPSLPNETHFSPFGLFSSSFVMHIFVYFKSAA